MYTLGHCVSTTAMLVTGVLPSQCIHVLYNSMLYDTCIRVIVSS